MAYEQQRRGIQNNVNIIIATPGRLIAHLTSGVLKFNDITHLVLDEADRMLDMGFSDDIMRIIGYLPKKASNAALFSATMPGRIRTLAKAILNRSASKLILPYRNQQRVSISRYTNCMTGKKRHC
jgi:ATP-dependent RNA helicase RhlE